MCMMLNKLGLFCSLKTEIKSINVIKANQDSLVLLQWIFRVQENIKSREVTRGALASAPSANHPPPKTAFFIRGRNLLFQILGGVYLEWDICQTCFETGGAYAPYATRLRTSVNWEQMLKLKQIQSIGTTWGV